MTNFETVSRKSKKTKPPQRLYVGNLPLQCENLEAKLTQLFQTQGGATVSQVDVVPRTTTKTCHAIVTCENPNSDAIIKKLHRHVFQGKKLIVQRERKQNDRSFGSSDWSKPAVVEEQEDDLQLASRVADAVSSCLQQATEGESALSPLDAAISVTAATTMVLGTTAARTEDAFQMKDMTFLLADYGEQDVEWDKKDAIVASGNDSDTTAKQPLASMLGQQGKAPIHVNYESFGYMHGAPVHQLGHAHPLAPYDVRHFLSVPNHLAWQDGLGGSVRYELFKLNNDKEDGTIKQYAAKIAQETLSALKEAIDAGYGYAMPLVMTIPVGSESGRHRSVVVAEVAATELRKQLRAGAVQVPCSVGSTHLHLDRKQQQSKSNKKDDDDR